jgi:hypothetical protein
MGRKVLCSDLGARVELVEGAIVGYRLGRPLTGVDSLHCTKHPCFILFRLRLGGGADERFHAITTSRLSHHRGRGFHVHGVYVVDVHITAHRQHDMHNMRLFMVLLASPMVVEDIGTWMEKSIQLLNTQRTLRYHMHLSLGHKGDSRPF